MYTALIVAAGSGSRSQLNESKVLYQVNEKPIFLYSVETFLKRNYPVVLVVSKSDMKRIQTYVDDRVKLVVGGKTRSESVRAGLAEVMTPYVLIHDAARPLIQEKHIINIEKMLELHDAVCLAEPVTSALKYYHKGEVKSKKRDDYVLAQTPQAFLTEKIKHAYVRHKKPYDDDISLYQAFFPKEQVEVMINHDANPKLTYPKDFEVFKMQIEREPKIRMGHSFDIHQLKKDRPLVLGGLQLEHSKGLLGHSDADVLLHAISEAMLGALALGDLGTHFPDTDPTYKNMDSQDIIKKVYDMIIKKGYDVVNIDASIYAEAPKMKPYILKMRQNISKLCHTQIDRISVKATTYEKLDAIGKEEAIAAEAVVLLERKL